jgi:hypothetical protein
MLKELVVVLGLLVVLAASGCIGSSLNSNPPDYVKTVSATKDGPGLQIYFILADKSGAMTTADGKFVIEMTQKGNTIYKSNPINVTKGTFEQRSVGMGNFAHDVVMYLVGRIPFSGMYSTPENGMGEVKITFTTSNGREMEGKDTVFF